LLRTYALDEHRNGAGIGLRQRSPELSNLLRAEIQAALQVRVVPLAAGADADGLSCTATTEGSTTRDGLGGAEAAAPLRLRPDPEVTAALRAAVSSGRLLLVLRDPHAPEDFLRGLGVGAAGMESSGRLVAVSATDRAAIARWATGAAAVYVSPLANGQVRGVLPSGTHFLRFQRHLAADSLTQLEAALVLAASARSGDGRLPPPVPADGVSPGGRTRSRAAGR